MTAGAGIRATAAPTPGQRRDPLVRQMVLVLWGLFAASIVTGALAPNSARSDVTGAYRLANATFWLFPIALLGIGVFVFPWVFPRARARSSAFWLLLPVLGMTLMSFAVAVVSGGDLGRQALFDAVPYLLCVLAPIGGMAPGLASRLRAMLGKQVFAAAAFGALVLATVPIDAREDFSFPHQHAYALLFATSFLAPQLPLLGAVTQVGVLTGVGVVVALHLLGQNRLAVAVFGALVPMSAAISAIRAGRGAQVWRVVIGCVLAGGLVAGAAQFTEKWDFSTAFEATLSRFTGSTDLRGATGAGLRDRLDYEVSRSRGAEAADFLEWAGPDVWLVGNGAGRGWPSKVFGADWPMVHLGPLNLVLRGGVLLAAGFIGLFLVAIARAVAAARRSPMAAGIATYLVAWFLGFISHGPFGITYSTVLVWVFLGMALGRVWDDEQRGDERGTSGRAGA